MIEKLCQKNRCQFKKELIIFKNLDIIYIGIRIRQKPSRKIRFSLILTDRQKNRVASLLKVKGLISHFTFTDVQTQRHMDQS